VNEKRVDGAPRAVGIYEIEHREVCVELHPVVAQFLLQTLAPCHRKGHAVDADGLACRCVLCQPVYQVDSVGAVLLHHLEASVLQLLFSLDEIAGISPAISLVHKDYGCAVGAVARLETREPFAAAPMMRRQLALMRVGAGYDHGINAVLLHHLAQAREVFEILLHYLWYWVCIY
jgi:hypothetical protein